jgi:hypothetical protein
MGYSIRRWAVFGLVYFALLATIVFNAATGNYESEPSPCVEDMACWDCETMGNLVCGPRP